MIPALSIRQYDVAGIQRVRRKAATTVFSARIGWKLKGKLTGRQSTSVSTGADLVGSGRCHSARKKSEHMPHVIVKVWPGKSEAEASTHQRNRERCDGRLDHREESVSVAIEEIKR